MLLAASQAGFETYRVTYDPGRWGRAPDHLVVSGRDIELGGSRARPDEDETVTLADSAGANRLVLTVIAPETGTTAAGRLLDLSGGEDGAGSGTRRDPTRRRRVGSPTANTTADGRTR